MLPKFHKKMGMDVEIIANLMSFDKDGNPSSLNKGGSYINEYGIPVTRLNYKKHIFSKRLRTFEGLYQALSKSGPDIIFIHNCQFIDSAIFTGSAAPASSIAAFNKRNASWAM
jgi:1,2-diacylglycerol 3-alpha-glucosyltransferase